MWVTTDQHILALLEMDKKAGFKALFDRYYRPMCILGVKYINSLDVVEDLVQDIFTSVWKLDDYNKLSNIRSYLFTAVKNKSLTYLKKQKQISFEDINLDWEKDLYIQEDDNEIIQEKIQLVKEAIQELAPACREVFEKVVIAGASYKETAEDLNLSINTVKSQMKRAYRTLDNHLHIVLLLLLFE